MRSLTWRRPWRSLELPTSQTLAAGQNMQAPPSTQPALFDAPAGQGRARQNGQNDPSRVPGVFRDLLKPDAALHAFLRSLEARNRSALTIRAYATDLRQFFGWVEENTYAPTLDRVERADVTEYLAQLGRQGLSGVSRARKLAAIREFFRFLEADGAIANSPTLGVETPKAEKHGRTYLRPEEYTKMLSLAGGSPRDFAILQVFLQTGIRVSELCNLRLGDVDLEARTLRVTAGKGMAAREIELEKRGILALKSWLAARPDVPFDHLFLNCDGEPIGERGVRKLVVKYRMSAGITKKASCHSLRHTFATYKAERGVSPFQLQRWLGHANLNTTQIYVHIGRQNAKRVMEATSL